MRISPPEQTNADAQHPLLRVRPLAPEIIGAGLAFSSATTENSTLTLREFEAARSRTAEINGCLVCQAFRTATDVPAMYGERASTTVAGRGPAPDERFYAEVSQWRTSTLFSDRERLAIEYAERIGIDPHGIAADEEFWARAKSLFSDAELVDLSFCIAAWLQGRVVHALGLDGSCALPPRAG